MAKETGWSYRDILWEIPIAAVIQIYDISCWLNGADLRWTSRELDIDVILKNVD